jgi:Ca2+-binding RTX toxin-like protein
MAIFHITPATSVFTNFVNNDAFDLDSPGADTLIVDPGAFLIAANGGGGALLAANTGAWTVTVNGSIIATGSIGIALGEGDAVSTIKIGVEGSVQGGTLGVALGSSANINNAGEISGTVGIQILSGNTHTITNSGTIIGATFGISDLTNMGTDTVKNFGTINGDVNLFAGKDTVTNSGLLVGNVVLGEGNDTMTDFTIVGDVMKSGTITGTISLGEGNDTFTGGGNSETVKDDDGADIVKLGGGSDTYIATGSPGADGIDVVNGGAGVDTYDASLSSFDLSINLDSVAHDLTPLIPGTGLTAANTATGFDISGATKDTITGLENAKAGTGNDSIYGTAAGNALSGGGGVDALFGFGGKDVLDGGTGSDFLFGGSGKDDLTGGSGTDFFEFTTLSDSGIAAATRDLIADFEQGSDKIDVHLIDANKTTAGDDAFTFIGNNAPFTGTPGQLHAFWNAIGQIVEGDVNGDKVPDFSIQLKDPTHAITLTGASFNL